MWRRSLYSIWNETRRKTDLLWPKKKIQITYLSLRINLLCPLKFTTVHIVVDAAEAILLKFSSYSLKKKMLHFNVKQKKIKRYNFYILSDEAVHCSLIQNLEIYFVVPSSLLQSMVFAKLCKVYKRKYPYLEEVK